MLAIGVERTGVSSARHVRVGGEGAPAKQRRRAALLLGTLKQLSQLNTGLETRLARIRIDYHLGNWS